ncbi:MAG: glycosidase [Dehalococcoidia bacterium]|nr:glycosidase [Dehalococcoidia bacterium]
MVLSLSQNHIGERIAALNPRLQLRTCRARDASFDDVDNRFKEVMQRPLSQAAEIGEADIVVGIPFHSESDTISSVLDTIRDGLRKFYPDRKCVIVAAGSPAGGEALKLIDESYDDKIDQIAFLLDDERINGKGWSLRAIMEVTRALEADLVILEADLRSRTTNGEVEGLAPDWISLLHEPVRRGKADLVVSRFNQHYANAPVSALLFYPLVTAIYNRPLHLWAGVQWGISNRLIRTYLQTPRHQLSPMVLGYGVDVWLLTKALTSGDMICEANLGIKLHHQSSLAKRSLVLRQACEVMFEQIVADRDWWEEIELKRESCLPQPLLTYGTRKTHQPDEVQLVPEQLGMRYKQGYYIFHSLYERVLPQEAYQQLEGLVKFENAHIDFPTELWVQTVYHLLLAYAFSKDFAMDDVLNSLIPLHNGFMCGFVRKTQLLRDKLTNLPPEEADYLASLESDRRLTELLEEFLRQKPDFMSRWVERAEALKSPVPQITYREFIPGVPLIVPTELITPEGHTVRANEIYDAIFARQKEGFEHFVYERLQVPREAGSAEIAQAIKDFLHVGEEMVLRSSDLSTVEGTERMVRAIFDSFPQGEGFSLIPEMALWFLKQYPPSNLFTRMGYAGLEEMLQDYDSLDILALTSWSEEKEYDESLRKLIRETIRPEHFASCPIKPVVVDHVNFPSLVEMKDSSALDKLCSRVVVSNLRKGMGGEFPKGRYFTTVTKNIVEAERFGKIWKRFASERKAFGQKVNASLEGHWGREPLSAHSIFEDGTQRILARQLKERAERVEASADGDEAHLKLAEILRDIADSYHLALTLPDGTFVTCSMWSWASYSFKGGKGLPPPLSLHVERDWTSREFLLEYYKAAGGTEEEVEEKIIELMEQGREWEDMASILLGTEKGAEQIVCRETITPWSKQPLAGNMTRFAGNPVLEPIKEHPWESKYVLNAGMIRLDGKVYMVYRAFGDDEVSRLGLATSEDGFHFTERLEKPIFEPKRRSEKKGCEDPRLILMDGRIYMSYTAYDGIVAQIALASIGADDFTNYRWKKWHRHGLVFPGFNDKDAALFPETFNGKYAMLHRVDPHIWVTFSNHLRCPWPRKEHKILAGSTYGMMWDGKKIGAGAQPIKTKYGWLLITHGVDFAHFYRLGVMLLDLENPSKLIYRSPNFVLEPQEACEIGKEGQHWVPNVVFTCGALPKEHHGKEMLDADDELIVYYGAADTLMNIATATVGTLIPEEVRKGSSAT